MEVKTHNWGIIRLLPAVVEAITFLWDDRHLSFNWQEISTTHSDTTGQSTIAYMEIYKFLLTVLVPQIYVFQILYFGFQLIASRTGFYVKEWNFLFNYYWNTYKYRSKAWVNYSLACWLVLHHWVSTLPSCYNKITNFKPNL